MARANEDDSRPKSAPPASCIFFPGRIFRHEGSLFRCLYFHAVPVTSSILRICISHVSGGWVVTVGGQRISLSEASALKNTNTGSIGFLFFAALASRFTLSLR